MMLLHAGAPIAPHDLWPSWTFEPGVVAGLGLTLALHTLGARRMARLSTRHTADVRKEQLFFLSGMIVTAVALISPLHRLGGVLFSAHMVQHELLMAIAAPLLVLGRPLVPLLWSFPLAVRKAVGIPATRGITKTIWRGISNPFAAWFLHAAAIWIWHAPRLYDASVRSEPVHIAQHLSFVVTAILFWWSILQPGAHVRGGVGIISLFTTGLHTTLLGASITIADRPLYSAYNAAGTNLWGLSPLSDQQLGGLIMWVPAGAVYLGIALHLFIGWIKESGERVQKAESIRRVAASAGRAMYLVILAGSLAAPMSLIAQQDTARLAPVVVTVTRGQGTSVLESPFALSVVRPDSSRPGQRHTAIDETLSLLPGVAVTNRNNPSQDARLSIRGFGARSTFGVRGVRVLRDGMPLTLPDGQTPLDYLSLESVGRIEVMRGAASALYGNASGGVIDIRSAPPAASPFVASGSQLAGNNSFLRAVIDASGTSGSATYLGDVAYSRSDGTRAHSRQRATTAFGRAGFLIGSTDVSATVLALNNPMAENPGALTIDELNADPTQADALSVRRNARKAVHQIQVGLSADRSWTSGSATVSAFGGARSLDNPLTFAVVEVGRHSYGASARMSQHAPLSGLDNRVSAGIDFQSQNDLRRNFAVCADTVPRTSPTATCPSVTSGRGVVTLDQRELVSSAGGYLSDELSLGERVAVTAAVRADNVRFKVKDRLITQSNPDDSGRRSMAAITPILGALVRLTPTHSLYANLAGAFETPTATELGNHPDGTAGINPDLEPQRSTTAEFGAKGFIGTYARYDAAVFSTSVRDELVPFEIPNSSGRRYFRNAGRTRRRGAEAGVDVSSGPWSVMGAYSYSNFRFVSFTSAGIVYDDNTIPGVPAHHWQTAVKFSNPLGFAVAEGEGATRVLLNDANNSTGPGYAVANFRIGTAPIRRLSRLSASAGVQNVFDRHYAASIAVNAARAKFFEPAATRNFFVALSLTSGR
ncbi:MAG TPA: TonB-dependent receptor [Gemmatimonadaceae bacterium]|nr:TonB-dependent receptor [Gemmatimonadaceae bacterium]